MAIKNNRTVAVTEESKQQGHFCRIDSLKWSEKKLIRGWLKGLDFPVLLHRQVFTNKDGSIGILYLAYSNFNCDMTKLEAIYQKRWNVEVFHKTLKSNTGLAKSPTKSIRTQSNHIFMSVYAAFQLECLKLKSGYAWVSPAYRTDLLKHKMNHFALRNRIYVTALKQAMCELNLLKSA